MPGTEHRQSHTGNSAAAAEASPDPTSASLMALVRLLARQSAREQFLLSSSPSMPEPGTP